MNHRTILINSFAILLTLAVIFTITPALTPASTLNAQERVYIDTAGVGIGITIDGQPVRKLLRDVKMRTDKIRIDADSAYHYIDDAIIRAYRVRLENNQQETLYADTLIHRIDTGDSSLFGSVILQTPDYSLFSQRVDIDGETDLATFPSTVLFRDDGAALRADSGFYNQQTDSAGFYGQVQLADSTRYIESDTLLMNRTTQIFHFRGNIYGEETDGTARFTGNSFSTDSTGRRLIRGTPAWLMNITEQGSDTTHLMAQEITILETDTTSTMDAMSGVRIYSNRFAGVADTLHFRAGQGKQPLNETPEDSTADKMYLSGDPILWTDQIQLTGPTIELHTRDNEITFLSSEGGPFAALQDTSTSRLHQMTGDTLHAWFDDGEITRLLLFHQHELLFHQKKENGEPDGLMTLVASERSVIWFDEGEPSEFKAVEGIDGSFVPEQEGLEDRKLQGFRWNPEMRPSEPVMLQRQWRNEVTAPLFPLPEKYLIDTRLKP